MHEEPMVEAEFLKKPCVGDTRVEYRGCDLDRFTYRFRIGKRQSKIGARRQKRTKRFGNN